MEIFGYEFKNEALLEEALTTPAYRMDVPDATGVMREYCAYRGLSHAVGFTITYRF